MSPRERIAWRSAQNWVKANERHLKGWDQVCANAMGPGMYVRADAVRLSVKRTLAQAKEQLRAYEAGEIDENEVLACGQDALARQSVKKGLVSQEDSGMVQ